MTKNICFLSIITIAFFIVTNSNAQTSKTTSTADFDRLIGKWQGTLTYIDYSTGKPYTMSADAEIKRLKQTNKYIVSNIYPDEADANSADTISISSNGMFIDGESVRSRIELENGDVEIITEESGTDGNDDRPATFRHTYIIGSTTFTKRKDVLFEGESEWMNRHEYSYMRMHDE